MTFLKNLFLRHTFPILPAFLLAGTAAVYFNERFRMEWNLFLFAGALLLWLILLRALDCLKRRFLAWVVFALLLAGVLILLIPACLPVFGGENDIAAWWYNYNPTTGDLFDPRYAFFTMVIFFLGAGAVAYLLQKAFPLRIFSAALILASFVLLAVFGETAPTGAFLLALTCLILIVAEVCYRTSPGQRSRLTSATIAAFLLPAALLASLITVAIPQPEKPISWQFVLDAIDDIQSKLGLYFFEYGGGFDMATLGYSETTDPLGGNVTTRPGNILVISFPGGKPRNGVYLCGSVQDTYTGISWERNAVPFESPYPENELDTIEMLHAIEMTNRYTRFTPNDLSSLIRGNRYTIIYRDIPWTQAVFLPPKVLYQDHGRFNRLNYEITSTGARFASLTREATYNGYYLDVNYGGALFQTVCDYNALLSYGDAGVSMLDGWDGSFDSWSPVGDAINTDYYSFRSSEKDVGEILRDRADWIRANYTNLPDSLPERVRELTERITADCDNDFDRLRKIERYLSSDRFNYTLTPGAVPEGRDFVDYFLFENPNGYCTYYATAMAVMARTIGIPTRYAQGFSARCDRWLPSMATSSYYVLQEEAHAWPEAYIEGVGWIPFEPTASRQGVRYTEWDSGGGPAVPQEEDSPYDNMDGSPDSQVIPGERQEGADLTFDYRLLVLVLIVLGVLALLLTPTVLFAARRSRKKSAYRRADDAGKLFSNFRAIFTILEAMRHVPEGGETLSAFAGRIAVFYQFSDVSVKDVFTRYAETYYSGAAPDPDLLSTAVILREDLLATAKRRLRRLRYLALLLRLNKAD